MKKYRLLDQSDIIESTDEWYDADNDCWTLAKEREIDILGFNRRSSLFDDEEEATVGTQWDYDYPPYRRKLDIQS